LCAQFISHARPQARLAPGVSCTLLSRDLPQNSGA
jgi:hypothetical protein